MRRVRPFLRRLLSPSRPRRPGWDRVDSGWAAGVLTIALLLATAPAVAGLPPSGAPAYSFTPLVPAPRPAHPDIPAAAMGFGEPDPDARTGAPGATAATPSLPAVPPVGTALPDSSAKRRAPAARQSAAKPPAATTRSPRLVASGTASWVDPSYGPGYLALPVSLGGRGVLVRLCALGRCVTRRSTDAGPVPSLHRVADLSFADFAFLCGCDPRGPGLLRGVEVWAL